MFYLGMLLVYLAHRCREQHWKNQWRMRRPHSYQYRLPDLIQMSVIEHFHHHSAGQITQGQTVFQEARYQPGC